MMMMMTHGMEWDQLIINFHDDMMMGGRQKPCMMGWDDMENPTKAVKNLG